MQDSDRKMGPHEAAAVEAMDRAMAALPQPRFGPTAADAMANYTSAIMHSTEASVWATRVVAARAKDGL